MLVNVLCSLTVLYEYGPRFLKSGQSPIEHFFEIVFKF